jgi:NADPH:quinone reductase-like Zn-dependent oxidoreductase
MKAAQGKDYGPIDEMISVQDNIPLPPPMLLPLLPSSNKASSAPPSASELRRNRMIVKVLSVALAPGDCRVLSGLTRELQGPPSFPYVPGGDCSGIVVKLPPSSTKEGLPFTVGDRVACRFDTKPMGALAEYAVVSTRIADRIPDGISGDEAAALVSASPAVALADRLHLDNQRVLVMGARGGVGAHFCQILKAVYGASYVVGVSSRPDDVLNVARPSSNNPDTAAAAVDECIDYTQEDVFTLPRFQRHKFDLIVDFAGFGYNRLEDMARTKQPLIVKTAREGGRFVTFVPPVGPIFEIRGIAALLKTFVFPLLWKAFSSRTFRRGSLPKYTFGNGLPESRSCVTKTFELAQSKQLKAVVDPQGPFPFTTEGVRAAFCNLESRHSWGKTVIRVSDDDNEATPPPTPSVPGDTDNG